MANSRSLQGHQARKRFGQNFLTSHHIIDSIVAAVGLRAGDRLIEIGPGLGALTFALLDQIESMSAIELDRDLVKHLQSKVDSERLRLVQADALALDWAPLLIDGPVRLIGNLPYNISTPLLVRLINLRRQVIDQHFMLQREVVHRMTATQGADYSRLGILLQAFYRCEKVLDVPPESFNPAPKVHSAVIRMVTLDTPAVDDAAVLSELLSAAFGQRRKMLRKTLIPWLQQREIPSDHIDGTSRAEAISASVYYDLANQLSAAARD